MNLTNSQNELTFGSFVDAVQNIEDATSMSLFQYTKRSTINSRVFIERAIGDEEILTPLMLNIMNLYVGLILTAVDMNRYVTSAKKVRDMMSVVATESIDDMPKYTSEMLSEFFKGSTRGGYDEARMDISRSDGSTFDDDQAGEPTSIASSQGGSVIDPEPKNASIPSGRIIEVSFGTNRQPDANNFTVNLFLQLIPHYIPSNVAQEFVGLNFAPSVKQRWLQLTAGEISFFKDFVMGQDMRKRRLKALKADRTGILKEMENRKENNLADYWMKLAMIRPERQNLANTILIFEKNSFDRACSRSGLRWKSYQERQKFFNRTFVMMLCTVDPMYNKVEMFYHGLEAVSHFTFDQVKRNAKSESMDLIKIMENYAKGMAPKF